MSNKKTIKNPTAAGTLLWFLQLPLFFLITQYWTSNTHETSGVLSPPHQDIDEHIKVVCNPESSKADASEIVWRKDVHKSKNQQQKHPSETWQKKRKKPRGLQRTHKTYIHKNNTFSLLIDYWICSHTRNCLEKPEGPFQWKLRPANDQHTALVY